MPRIKNDIKEAKRRAEILAAAKQCFSQHGFHQTSMRQIIEKSNISAGGVYHYFASKNNIVEAIAAEEREGIEHLIQSLASAKKPLRGLVRFIRDLVVYTPREDAILAAEIFAETCRNPDIRTAVQANDQAIAGAVLSCLIRGRQDGCISEETSVDEQSMLVNMVLEGMISRVAIGVLSPKKAAAVASSTLTKLLAA